MPQSLLAHSLWTLSPIALPADCDLQPTGPVVCGLHLWVLTSLLPLLNLTDHLSSFPSIHEFKYVCAWEPFINCGALRCD